MRLSQFSTSYSVMIELPQILNCSSGLIRLCTIVLKISHLTTHCHGRLLKSGPEYLYNIFQQQKYLIKNVGILYYPNAIMFTAHMKPCFICKKVKSNISYLIFLLNSWRQYLEHYWPSNGCNSLITIIL